MTESQPSPPRPWYLVTGGYLVLIFLVKGSTLQQVPVWDTAMSVFQSALALVDSNFNAVWIFRQGGISSGGPNAHATSIVTWLTGLAMRLLADRDVLLPVLHVVHFTIAALALNGVYRFSRDVVGDRMALAVGVLTLLFPFVSTQAGYLYLEIPLFLCVVYAMLAWSRGRIAQAAAWAMLACLVKSTGLVLVGALAVAALWQRRPWSQRWLQVAAIVTGPLLLTVAVSVFVTPHSTGSLHRPPESYWFYLYDYVVLRLARVPDLCALVVLAALSGLVRVRSFADTLRTPPGLAQSTAQAAEYRVALSHLLVLAYLGLFVVLPLSGTVVAVLIRYYVMLVPFLLLIALELLGRFTPQRIAWGVVALAAVWFTVNHRGAFYPGHPRGANDMSLVERSGEYVDLLAVQQRGITALAALPPQVPKLYALPEFYLVRDPRLGYVSEPLPQGFCAQFAEPYRSATLRDCPERFYMFLNHPHAGGEKLVALMRQARRDPDWTVEMIESIQAGEFRGHVLEVRKKSS